MPLSFGAGLRPDGEGLEGAEQARPVEKISGVKKDQQKHGERAGCPGIALGPTADGGAPQSRAKRRDALPRSEDQCRQTERTRVDDVCFLVEDHPGEPEHGGP